MIPCHPSLDWLEDPEVFSVHAVAAHSDHTYYQDEQEAAQGKMTLKQSLNGAWKFAYAPNPSLRIHDFYTLETDLAGFDTIQVPGHIQLQGYDKSQYTNTLYPWDGQEHLRPPFISKTDNPVASYVKEFVVEEPLKGKRTFLSFQGVETAFYVWVNGEFVGYGEDSFTPTEFEVTAYLKEGINRLAVEVYKRSSASWIEDQDFWRFSGIFREVYLYAIPSVHVADVSVQSPLVHDYTDGHLSIKASMVGDLENVEVELALFSHSRELLHQGIIAGRKELEYATLLKGVHPWSAESPYLYDLEIRVRQAGQLLEIVKQRVGFRTFELRDGLMQLNGKRIVFKGINRHEFHHERGRAITEKEMLWDIQFLKQHNVNAVRTSHYPNQSLWYDLCDEYGIYLIDETNLESHGSWQKLGETEPSWNVPGSLPQWRENVLNRANNMVQRDKNHPSILLWSCGNESYAGDCILAMADFFRKTDPSRLVHYEGVFWNRDYDAASDIESQMYPTPADVVNYLESKPKKPILLCEYMHAMGNSLGGMKLYTDLADQYDQYQGGFIWDYIDQSLLKRNTQGQDVLTYGGDWGDRTTDYEFCGNGVVFADRKVTPKAQEMKQLYANVAIFPDSKGVRIVNHNAFVDTSDSYFTARLKKDGVLLWEQSVTILVKAGEEGYQALDFPARDEDGEYTYEVSQHLAKDTIWAKAGYELSFGQTLVGTFSEKSGKEPMTPLRVVRGDGNIGVHGSQFSVLLSLVEGGMTSYVKNGVEYLTRTPKVTFWRSLTDNDRGAKQGFERGIWLIAGLYQNYISAEVEEDADSVTVTFTHQLAMSGEVYHTVSYTVDSLGRVRITGHYPGYESLPSIPAYGLEMKLPLDYQQVRYYGLGPDENYCDRLSGARLGIFETNARKNHAPYPVPQETGNRCGLRWLEVTDSLGKGLRFTADGAAFEGSVLPYSAYELDCASHQEDLPIPHYTWLRLLSAQMGVGGDNSWGAPVHDEYHLKANQARSFSIWMDAIE